MSDNSTKDKNHEVEIAKINYKQAIWVAVIAIIPTIFATYWTTKSTGTKPEDNWKEKYLLAKQENDSLKSVKPIEFDFSDLSVLLMDSYENKYHSVEDGEMNSHLIEEVIENRGINVQKEIYPVRQADKGQLKQLNDVKNKKPDLIIIHRSAFPKGSEEDSWLISFIESLLNDPDTKNTRVLIYSRSFDDQCFKSSFPNAEHRKLIDINVWCNGSRMRPFTNQESIDIIGDMITNNLNLILLKRYKKAANKH